MTKKPTAISPDDPAAITNEDIKLAKWNPVVAPLPEVIEQALVGGDLSKLTTEQRVNYYNSTCQSLGLNPRTRPFEYLSLNGKLVLYARKDCTEQLRKIHGVSVDALAHAYHPESGVYVVTATGHDKTGRNDSSTGAVPFPQGLKGEAAANAVMKAETKAKRRLTLSICGLGMLDETELDTMPANALPMGACLDCGNPIPPNRTRCEEHAQPHTVPQLTEGVVPPPNGNPRLSTAEEKKQSITGSKEVNEFVSLLAEHFPDAALRQQVGFAVTGTRTANELKAYPVEKLANCVKVLREVVKRVKKENIVAPDDIVCVVGIVREDFGINQTGGK